MMTEIEKKIEKVWSRLGIKYQIINGHLKWKKTLRTVNCSLCPKHDRESRIDQGFPGWNMLTLAHSRDGKMPEVCPTCNLKLTRIPSPLSRIAECRTCHATQKEKLFGLGWPGWQMATPNESKMICPDCALNLCLKLGKDYVHETWYAFVYNIGQVLTANRMNQNQASILEVARPLDNLIRAGEFESWGAGDAAAPEGWTASGAGETIAREGTTVRYGENSASLQSGGNPVWFQQIILTGIDADTHTHWWGAWVFFGCWVYATAANIARISIDDGVSAETFSGYHTPVAGWEWLTVVKQLDAAANQLQVRLNVAGVANATAYFDGAILVEGEMVESFSHHAQQATIDADAPPIKNFLYKDAVVKAWINFRGDGAGILERDSFNVSSITDNGPGDYRITWDTDFATTDYICVVSGTRDDLQGGHLMPDIIDVSNVDIDCYTEGGAARRDMDMISVIAIGDQ